LDFSTPAAANSGVAASRRAAASAPVKFGILPLAPGKRAAPAADRAAQTRSRTSCLAARASFSVAV